MLAADAARAFRPSVTTTAVVFRGWEKRVGTRRRGTRCSSDEVGDSGQRWLDEMASAALLLQLGSKREPAVPFKVLQQCFMSSCAEHRALHAVLQQTGSPVIADSPSYF